MNFILSFLLFAATATATVAADTTTAKRPNILWITAENMGPDLGCYPDSPWAKQVRTPHLDQFAREGMRYRLAFDTSPICSPSRSAFMTGMYQTTIGAHNHRSHRHDHFQLPEGVRPLTHRLVEAGYFAANITSMGGKQVGTGKTDLNFEVTGPVLNTALARTIKSRASDGGIDDTSQNARNSARLYHTTEWTDLKSHQPFFAQVNLPVVERGGGKGWTGSTKNPWNGQTHPEQNDPDAVTVPPYYPDHPITRRDWAGYLDAVCGVDARAGEILTRLATDGLADDTVVIFFADNGRLEARGLDWCYDSGDRVPLIVRWPVNFPAPPQYEAGTTNRQLISLLDLHATTLAIAGVPKPVGMQSRIFLGVLADPEREVVFSARDRADEAVNRIRAARGPRYRYIRNFMPERPFTALHRYKEAIYPVMPLLRQLHGEGGLNAVQSALMVPRSPEEELYDLESDPFEIRNLATSADPEHQRVRKELSAALEQWIEATNDQGRTPEPADVQRQWIEEADRRFGTPAWAKTGGASAGSASAPTSLTLVAKDTAPAPIIVFKGAPPRTRDAAVKLAEYIEKISGQRPTMMDGEPGPTPERAIWIGYQPALKTLFPNTDFDFKHTEETLILANEKHLVIAGRDRWDPKHMTAKGRLSIKTGMQQEYGTANAVYTFIRDQLGVRWLWPGEEDVTKQDRIAIAPMEQRYHPQIRARAGLFTKLELGDHKEGPDLEWARVQRLQLDSMEIDGGHGFGDWWEKYSKTNPDFFALQPDGSRSPHPTPNNTKLCESNPGVWKQWLTEVEEQLRENPTQRVFNVSENDGYDFGHCVCKDCLAKDHPHGEKFTFRWRGRQEERPSLTDRQVQFANTLGRMLKQRYPDKELYVQLLAYGYSRPAPVAAVPDDNVIIANVGNFALRGPKEREVPMKQHAEWAAKARHIMWRPNLGNPAGLSWGMPDVAITQMAEDFRFAADTQCLGLYFDMFWYHWSTQGPLYYALAHLAWNPHTDVKRLMDDYHQRTYGTAADDLKAYWELLERTRMEFVVEKPTSFRAFDLPAKYTPELFAKAQAHLDSAAAKLTNADEKFRRRLHFTRCGLEFTKLVVDTRTGMRQFEASKGKNEAAKAHVLANWERTVVMQKQFPSYAINWMAVFRTPGSVPGGKRDKRGEGLHPDSPITPYTLKRMQAPGLE